MFHLLLHILNQAVVYNYLTLEPQDVKSAEMLLKKIWIYPLKSGKRVEVKEVEIRPDRCGLMYDRMFMVVNKMGEMVSQRSSSHGCRIEIGTIVKRQESHD